MSDRTLVLFAAQAQVVLDAIERDGFSRVKWEFIRKKYGSEAWIFQQAYSFYAQHAPQYVAPPEGAESGIWCFRDPKWAASGAGGFLLEMEVPADQAILFDSRIWNRMLNLEYIGKDEADEAAFAEKIANMGMKSSIEAFSTSFYPMVKREILDSWKRLFGSAEGCPGTYVEAGLWELRKEWIVSVRPV